MRKLISGFAASLDGYITGPNDEYDWIPINKEIDFAEMAGKYDTYFYGRKTYEAMLKYGESSFPKTHRHYVFSTTLASVQKNCELISNDLENHVMRIKKEEGKDIALFGGASLLASMLDLKLVDEIEIAIIPVLLGSGKPMVEVLNEKVWLELISYKRYENGTVNLRYLVKRDNSK
jgi:dihydrofolate reductase